jgi:hypothetical protein
MARIEFYREGAGRFLEVVDDDAVPRAGEYINISGKTWKVECVTWAVDTADGKPRLRANVDLVDTAE